jgi:nifR3 family TIM-barrel protein
MVTIGRVRIPTNIFLAPLSGCSDLAFRLIAREHGAQFCFFEMVDCNSLLYGRPRALGMLKTHERDIPIAAQLLGSHPPQMLDAAQKLLGLVKLSFLDINSACPAKKVIRKKAGAYFLRNPKTLYEIVKTLASSLPVPVSVKIRLGYEKRYLEDMVRLAAQCEANGAGALFVHGRTSAQGYKGDVDYEAIRAIKNAVRIPVFGTGNILTAELAKKMFDETGCDGILVARGALGNPWIFGEIERYLKGGEPPPGVDPLTKKRTLLRHLSYIDTYKEISASAKLCHMRKVAIWYTKGFLEATRARARICAARSYAELVDLIETL